MARQSSSPKGAGSATPATNQSGRKPTPPKHSQYPKGVSGNPKGRPKKERDPRKLLERELEQTVHLTENGKGVRLTKLEVMIKSLVNDAARGDKKAIAMVLDQLGPVDATEDQFAQLSAEEIAAFVARYLVPGKGAAR